MTHFPRDWQEGHAPSGVAGGGVRWGERNHGQLVYGHFELCDVHCTAIEFLGRGDIYLGSFHMLLTSSVPGNDFLHGKLPSLPPL